MSGKEKLKIAIGLGATCSGCDMAILDVGEPLLELSNIMDIVFWSTGADLKLKDFESLPNKSVDFGLYHGTVRTEEQRYVAELIREKCKYVVAFGTCACFGGIPALCNLTNRKEIFEVAYKETPSTVNPDNVFPQEVVEIDGKELTLPKLYNFGYTLDQVIDVDYYVPGCPPPVKLIENLFDAIKEYYATGRLPPKGTVFAPKKTLCDECPREKPEKISIKKLLSPIEKNPDPNLCLLAQGYLCLGPVTRAGCGAACPQIGMPCRGCMGPPDNIKDTGAKLISYIASLIGLDEEAELGEEGLKKLLSQVKDIVGFGYRFSSSKSIIKDKRGVKSTIKD